VLNQWHREGGRKGQTAPGNNQEGLAKMGVKFTKSEFHMYVLTTDMLITFKEKGALSTALLL